jgi:hypothetical protein
MTTIVPDPTQLDIHLRNVQSVLSKELDGINTWDDEQTVRDLSKAERMARLDGIELPSTSLVWASPEAQQVKVHLTLKLIVGDLRSGGYDDPRGEAFKALAQDLLAIVPSGTTVQDKLAVGIGVARSFLPTVATETVRAWAAEVLPVLRLLAGVGLQRIEQHNAIVDLIMQEQRAAMTRAKGLTAEFQEFGLN